MRDECLETTLVLTCEEVYRVATIACAYCAQTLLVTPRLGSHVVNCAEIVLDVLTAVVARYLVYPLGAERGYATTVGCYDDVALCRHQLEVPTVAPELANHTLRTALTEEEGGVLLVGVEVGRQDYPGEHLLAVGGGYPTLLHLAHTDIVIYLAIYTGELRECAVGCYREEFGCVAYLGHAYHDVVARGGHSVDVVITCGDYFYGTTCSRYLAYLVCSVHRSDEADRTVAVPEHVCCAVIEIGSEVGERAIGGVPYKQTLFVTLVTRTTHTAEGYLGVVGREYGVLVVAGHHLCAVAILLADVCCGACCGVVEEYVGVGRDSILGACLTLAGVGEYCTCIVPANLGSVEVGCSGCIPRLTLHDVLAGTCLAIFERRDEDVTIATLIPIVPVTYHQVVVDAGCRGGHILVNLFREAFLDCYGVDVEELIARRCNTKGLNTTLYGGYLRLGATICRSLPQLHLATARGEEVDGLAIGTPRGRRAVVDDAHGLATGKGERVDVGARLVLAERVVSDTVEYCLAVGREGLATNTTHLPHHLRGEDACLLLGRCQSVAVVSHGLLRATTASNSHRCHHNNTEFFNHCFMLFFVINSRLVTPPALRLQPRC